ncbi:restriction endonuclease [uncultured Nostoc sp.]|uniref:restriction endonuclease n=1 Tax=uncultured Nostoc sp. TaxID=340711 RepID=UPI0035CAD5B7
MPTAKEYEAKIANYKWDDLVQLWSEIESGDTPGWGAGKALEYLVLRAFELDGAEVTWPYSVRVDGDELEQIDGVVYLEGLACIIECKDECEAVDILPIAKLRNQLLRRPATITGIVFSRKGFTPNAVKLARLVSPQTILLWEGEEIKYSLQNKCIIRSLIKKYRHCIEHGLPDYNITIEVKI